MKKVCMILVLCLLVMLPCCKKKLPTQADIPTKVLPTIEYFHATPTSITIGGVSILSWSTKNATNITINQGVGTVSAKDTVEVSPEETTTYMLTATNSDGQKTQSCKVEVTSLNLPIIDYFIASPESIMLGEDSTLSWSVQPEGLTEALRIEPLGDLTISWEGSHTVSPTETTTYTLIATNSDGQIEASCTVEVTEVVLNPPTIEYFTADPDSIYLGEYSTLSWSVINATTLIMEKSTEPGSSAWVSLVATVEVSPIEPTTYTLTATNDDGVITASCTIHVIPNYEGTWEGVFVIYACQTTGACVDSTFCSDHALGNTYSATLIMNQYQDSVVGSFLEGNFDSPANVTGSIAIDGCLTLYGTTTEGSYTVAVTLRLQSTTPGQITGTCSEIHGCSDGYGVVAFSVVTLIRN